MFTTYRVAGDQTIDSKYNTTLLQETVNNTLFVKAFLE